MNDCAGSMKRQRPIGLSIGSGCRMGLVSAASEHV